jgi:hypothetical protein
LSGAGVEVRISQAARSNTELNAMMNGFVFILIVPCFLGAGVTSRLLYGR